MSASGLCMDTEIHTEIQDWGALSSYKLPCMQRGKKKKKKKKKNHNVEILYVLPGKESVGTTYLLLLGNAILLTFHDNTAWMQVSRRI